MLLLQQTYLWQQAGVTADNSSNSNGSDCHLADSARVRQLLLGCAELLRPAANCSVEWRCAALELMTAAVEQFRDVSPGRSSCMIAYQAVLLAVRACFIPLYWKKQQLGLGAAVGNSC